ncbi:MAG: hypothetical protein HRU07_00750 [Nitrosopumilus sp.]|nr:hypothetical protein [Nitrosopumilus sp.]NRA04706.1 hypothetical protein [Nitrosopumilus sp.]
MKFKIPGLVVGIALVITATLIIFSNSEFDEDPNIESKLTESIKINDSVGISKDITSTLNEQGKKMYFINATDSPIMGDQ